MKMSKRSIKGQNVGLIGVAVNLVLFVSKLFVGLMTNSIAILADGFNNLADCGMNLVTIFAFRFSARRADRGHPLGHGRMEYIAGLVMSMIIFVTALRVGGEAVGRIINPEVVTFSLWSVVVCVVAIVAKIFMALYARHINKTVKSRTLDANIWDSMMDSIATMVALLALVVAPFTELPIDGYLGVIVTMFIFVISVRVFVENASLLLGQGLSRNDQRWIRRIITGSDAFAQVKKIDIHDYGMEDRVLVVMVRPEMDPKGQVFEKELLDCKGKLIDRFGFKEVTFYWSPVDTKK